MAKPEEDGLSEDLSRLDRGQVAETMTGVLRYLTFVDDSARLVSTCSEPTSAEADKGSGELRGLWPALLFDSLAA